MKNLSPINDDKDIVTKGYADGKFLPLSGGVIEAAFAGSMANFKGLEVRRTGLTGDYDTYIKFSSNLKDNGFIGMNGSGRFRVVKINDDGSTSTMMNLNNGRLTTSASGLLLAETSIGKASGSITIENLSEYSSVWAYIDGNSIGIEFATNVIIPIAYLAKSTSNSVKLAGGIPSAAYTTSSGPQAPKDTSAYITAKVSGNVLNLTASSPVITLGNVMIVAM